AARKEPTLTATIASTVTCRFTVFAVTFRCLPSCGIVNAMLAIGALEALEKIVAVIRHRFGKRVCIILRADSGFAREPIMSWCEDNEVFYCFGLARNDRLSEELKGALDSLNAQIKEGKLESPCRRFTEFDSEELEQSATSHRQS